MGPGLRPKKEPPGINPGGGAATPFSRRQSVSAECTDLNGICAPALPVAIGTREYAEGSVQGAVVLTGTQSL